MSATKISIGQTIIETSEEITLPTCDDGRITIASSTATLNYANQTPTATSISCDEVFNYNRVVKKKHELIIDDVKQGVNDIVVFDGTCSEFYGFSAGEIYNGGNISYKIIALDIENIADLGVDTTINSSASQNAVLFTLRTTINDNESLSNINSDYNLSDGNQMEYLSVPTQPFINKCAVTDDQCNKKIKIILVNNNTTSKNLKIQLLPNMQSIPSVTAWNSFFTNNT